MEFKKAHRCLEFKDLSIILLPVNKEKGVNSRHVGKKIKLLSVIYEILTLEKINKKLTIHYRNKGIDHNLVSKLCQFKEYLQPVYSYE